jgi:hypothetical protein
MPSRRRNRQAGARNKRHWLGIVRSVSDGLSGLPGPSNASEMQHASTGVDPGAAIHCHEPHPSVPIAFPGLTDRSCPPALHNRIWIQKHDQITRRRLYADVRTGRKADVAGGSDQPRLRSQCPQLPLDAVYRTAIDDKKLILITQLADKSRERKPQIGQRIVSDDDYGYRRSGPHDRNANRQPAEAPLLVVVPAYNEQQSVGIVVRRIKASAPPCDVVVIDDGSSDETAAEACDAGALVIRLPFNLGIGGAVQTGFMFARDNGYQFMAQIDGDGQHDPGELEKLLTKLRSDPCIDMAYGSRFLEGERGYKVPISRRIGIQLFAVALTQVLRHSVTDPTSGFRLCNRRAIEFFATSYPHDYPEVESLLMLKASGMRFAEVPVQMYSRTQGTSSITAVRSAYYMVKVSLALLAGLLRGRVDVAGTTRPQEA